MLGLILEPVETQMEAQKRSKCEFGIIHPFVSLRDKYQAYSPTDSLCDAG